MNGWMDGWIDRGGRKGGNGWAGDALYRRLRNEQMRRGQSSRPVVCRAVPSRNLHRGRMDGGGRRRNATHAYQ